MSDRLPEGWSPKNFGDVVRFSGGSAFKEKYQGNNIGEHPFIKVSDMNLEGNERYIVNANNWVTDEVIKIEKIRLFPFNTTVFAKVGAALLLNRRRMLVRETAIDNNMMGAIATDCDPEFLFYLMQTIDLGKIVQSGAVPSVNQNQMETIPVNVPPVPEQKKIACILTSVDDAIENTQKHIDKLQDLQKATMNELLTKGIDHTEFKDSELGKIPTSWEVYRVSELLTQVKTKGKRKLPIYSVLIDGGMVNRNTLERRISSELDETSNIYVKEGNLAYNMMRMWQGASGIAPEDCMVSPAYVVCEPNEKIISKFLGFLLKSEASIQKLCAYSQGITSDRLRLYFEHFAQIKFAIPTLEEQEKIAEVIFAVENNILKTKQILGQTQSLKKSLMQDLLTGKVRVQVN